MTRAHPHRRDRRLVRRMLAGLVAALNAGAKLVPRRRSGEWPGQLAYYGSHPL